VFASREEAGRRLGEFLLSEGVEADLVLGLPRGGVVVAAEVAHALQAPLDVVIVRKIGHPLHREYAVGALAEPDVILLNERVLGQSSIIRAQLDQIIKEERERLRTYQAKFHIDGPPDRTGKAIVLVDDGLATGSTAEAAVISARKQGAHRIVVAIPVASTNAVERLLQVADDVRAIVVDPDFDAVGRYYDNFKETSDQEVLDLLNAEFKRTH
jgi:putative phosphoribosyl transferase